MNPKLDELKLALETPGQAADILAKKAAAAPSAAAPVAKPQAKCPNCGHAADQDDFFDWRKRNHGHGTMYSLEAEIALNDHQDSHSDNRVAADRLAKEQADLPGSERWITKRCYAEDLQPRDKVFLPPNTVLVVKAISNLGGKAWRKGSKNDGVHIEWDNGGNEQYSPNDMVDVVTGERKKLVMKGAKE